MLICYVFKLVKWVSCRLSSLDFTALNLVCIDDLSYKLCQLDSRGGLGFGPISIGYKPVTPLESKIPCQSNSTESL